MQLRNGKRKLDAYRPTFDPHLDIATVVFSHVQCVKTRVNLALVSKLWREASKPAAAYPLRFNFNAFPNMSASYCLQDWTKRFTRVIELLDNDEALSLPYERVVGLLGKPAKNELCDYAARRGSLRLLKWARVNDLDWSAHTCACAAYYGHLPALQYLRENGCPWDDNTCRYALLHVHSWVRQSWDCLQYAVDNKCPGWEKYAKEHAEHLR
jgi:hypothetical protein